MTHIFPEILTKLRTEAGLSQTELGDQLDISNRAISKWERGLSFPSTENLYKLANFFHVSVDYLFTGQAHHKELRLEESWFDRKHTGMTSLREMYKIGRGPSSSHTMGPEKACMIFKSQTPDADRYETILYGSLAKTGVGHGTDRVIIETMDPIPCNVIFNMTETDIPHPNTMDLIAYKGDVEIKRQRIMSVGGGNICFENSPVATAPDIYPVASFKEISEYCYEHNMHLWEYVEHIEGPEIWDYLSEIWDTMKTAIRNGLHDEGILPGGLNVQKRAKQLLYSQHIDESPETRENRMVCAYAFAVSEQNANGGRIVTAPTCGAAGVLPAVLYYQQKRRNLSDEQVIHALAAGGIIGNLIKTNASISGSECGCQAEVGSACAMAAAALGELFYLSMDKIEYAAEIAIEHHLGLTCDPICGLVQIPCIERNAVAAMRAINAVSLASFLSDSRKITLDDCIRIMKETGRDISKRYKETSESGLATLQIQ